VIDTTWLPRTPQEALVKADTILAAIVPRIGDARGRIIDVLPGHSGRPAGNGEPGGGSGASTSTVVERTLGIVGEDKKTRGIHLKSPSEMLDLNRIDHLVGRIVNAAQHMHGPALAPTEGGSAARRLTWARWLIRRLAALSRPPSGLVQRLYDDVCELNRLVDQWAAPHLGGKRTHQLAADDTGTWCRSCLRAGCRNPRDPRYPTLGLCRWCGDFRAAQGVLPSLDMLDAHESGSPLEVARLIRDTDKRTRKRKRR
jgi:hypothetical protein